MSLAPAILALLATGPLHGHAVARRLTRLLDGLRPVNPGQVYATLARLTRQQQVASLAPAPGARARPVAPYALLPAGRRALRRWRDTPAADAAAGGALVERLVVLAALADRARIARVLRAHAARCTELLHELDRSTARPGRAREAPGTVAVVDRERIRRAARRHLAAELAWLRDAERLLVAAPDA